MRIYLVIICMVLLVSPAYPAADTSFSLPASLNERIQVMTDRDIYAIGERILFAGINISPPELDTNYWSKVLYLELLTPRGTSVAQGKFPMSCSRASGYLTIPEHLLTGNYYLVAYTKWMRNFSPVNFHYQLIKIINPYTPQLETSNFSNGNRHTGEREEITLNKAITCSTDKASYRQREKVNLTINIPGSSRSLTNTYSVTVVRNSSSDTLRYLKILPEKVQYHRPPGTIYLPETRGLSLSGRVVSTDSAVSVPGENVNLAILGREPGFRVIPSGPRGSFCFVLDSMSGRNDMYIASNHDEENLEIRIDNDFANPAVRFPEIPFILSESEKELATEIIFNMQINSHFHSPGITMSEPGDEGEDPRIISFYGLPSSSILIDDYIELPTLKEVLIELVPGVFPRVRNKEAYLTFSGNKLTFTLINQYSPLLLVDQVPVFGLDELLLMSPKKIHRVEILNEIYIIGNTTYGGILNIITRKGDLAGIDLPENSFFFDFTSFLPQDNLDFPRYEDQEFDSADPDYRNCLYWSPDIKAAPGQDLELDFFTSDNSGDYMVLIRGVGEDGSILQGKCNFQVD
ncbi:MAG: hypothetical protein V3V53_07375 [Bacteroidales bacterium]